MPIRSVEIPQMGEGLREVLLVRLLKVPGDYVQRNEPLYEIETDKAVTEIESPFEGRLVEWLAQSGVVPVGAAIARIDAADELTFTPGAEGAEESRESLAFMAPPADRVAMKTGVRRHVPPRTRRYLRERGLLDLINLIPSSSRKLTPEDVDAFVRHHHTASAVAHELPYVDSELSEAQRIFNHRLPGGIRSCAPAVVELQVEWTALDAARDQLAQASPDKPPTHFVLLLRCVVRALERHPRFRSALTATGVTLRTYKNVSLGIAVALSDDRLVTAVIRQADTLDWWPFVAAVKEQVKVARNGVEQSCEGVPLTVSNIGSLGLDRGIPLLVSPAVATLVVGKVDWLPRRERERCEFRRCATLTLAFDHRIVNGAGCASFLTDIKRNVEHFTLPTEG